MNKSIFEFAGYKPYLEHRVGSRKQRSGLKSEMAQALECQPTYISQVLHGNAHFSLEQADRLNHFLAHSKEEAAFLFLLVQKDRAGTVSLRKHFDEQIANSLKNRMVLTERLGKKNQLSSEDQTRYYSTWHYAAIHIALTIPDLQNNRALADYFKLPLQKVNSTLDFLAKTGLAKSLGNGRYEAGVLTIRVGNDSPNIFRHHSNWRQMANESLDREEMDELHYSGVMSISHKDANRLKDRILEFLKETQDFVRDSKEEELYSFCIDLFSLRR
jgi:uncharacterized protein (TIGR02147 family)